MGKKEFRSKKTGARYRGNGQANKEEIYWRTMQGRIARLTPTVMEETAGVNLTADVLKGNLTDERYIYVNSV